MYCLDARRICLVCTCPLLLHTMIINMNSKGILIFMRPKELQTLVCLWLQGCFDGILMDNSCYSFSYQTQRMSRMYTIRCANEIQLCIPFICSNICIIRDIIKYRSRPTDTQTINKSYCRVVGKTWHFPALNWVGCIMLEYWQHIVLEKFSEFH